MAQASGRAEHAHGSAKVPPASPAGLGRFQPGAGGRAVVPVRVGGTGPGGPGSGSTAARVPPWAGEGRTGNGPSAPGSPGAAPAPPGAAASRFRVVKLDQGPGEPYRRGRWTCRDFYEQEAEHPPAGRLADSARHPQSLDSRLEAAGLLVRPPSPFSPQPGRRGAGLQAHLVLPGPGAPGHQARSLGGGLPWGPQAGREGDATGPPPGSPSPQNPQPEDRGTPCSRLPPSSEAPVGPGLPLRQPATGPRSPGQHPAPRRAAPAPQASGLVLARALSRQGPTRESRSRPSSPAPPLFRDGSPSRRTSDPFGAARLSLARSVLGMGAAHDSDDER
uniref:Uncharacterized protein n=1 Tax=Varanus komodoensis TaxID=61221 RepID=A0A8D2LGL2_VARKO